MNQRAHDRLTDERGSAIVEFHFLGILLLVPLVYVMLTALEVQKASYGVTQAAREAGRVFVATGLEAQAVQAANVALRDQGLDPADVAIRLDCPSAQCHLPGADVNVTVNTVVDLPFVPDALAGAINSQIPVSAKHVSVVDSFRELP